LNILAAVKNEQIKLDSTQVFYMPIALSELDPSVIST